MSYFDPHSSPARRTALATIRLKYEGNSIAVVPDEQVDLAAFTLPPLQKSDTDSLALVAADFLKRHQRCIGFVLFMNLKTRKWSWGVPRQRASFDSACWSASTADFPLLDVNDRVAGSFQVRVLASGEEPSDAPPPTEGVHLVLVVNRPVAVICCYLRIDEHLIEVPAPAVINDDLGQLLRSCQERAELV